MVDGIVGKKTIEAINKQIELINRKTVNNLWKQPDRIRYPACCRKN